eukprot:13717920-Ditylum_brightwellii.AAC.1
MMSGRSDIEMKYALVAIANRVNQKEFLNILIDKQCKSLETSPMKLMLLIQCFPVRLDNLNQDKMISKRNMVKAIVPLAEQ